MAAPNTVYSYTHADLGAFGENPNAPYGLVQTATTTDPNTGAVTVSTSVVASISASTIETGSAPETTELLVDVIVAALNGGASS